MINKYAARNYYWKQQVFLCKNILIFIDEARTVCRIGPIQSSEVIFDILEWKHSETGMRIKACLSEDIPVETKQEKWSVLREWEEIWKESLSKRIAPVKVFESQDNNIRFSRRKMENKWLVRQKKNKYGNFPKLYDAYFTIKI